MGTQSIDTSALAFGRETAERETAEEKATPRLLTEDEAYAIVADRVQRESAELTTKVSTLESEKAELQAKLDVAEAARETAEQAKVAAETALADHKAEQEREREIAERADDRLKKVREAASHLKDEFFTDERKQRWAGMEEDAFDAYVKELAELSEAAGVQKPAEVDGAPRETAMRGSAATATKSTGNLRSLWGRDNTEQKGA